MNDLLGSLNQEQLQTVMLQMLQLQAMQQQNQFVPAPVQPVDVQESENQAPLSDFLANVKKEEPLEEGEVPKESDERSRKRPAMIKELLAEGEAKKPKLEEPEEPNENDATLNDSQVNVSASEMDNSSTSASSPSSEPASVQNLISMLGGLQPKAVNDHDEFTMVPSRLALLTAATKYRMSVGEVRRRIDGPESFNLSLLGALFRRAKTPNMTETITKQLAENSLQIPKGRRRKTDLTLFSAFTEGECKKLVEDFSNLSQQFFPAKELAAHWNNQDSMELKEKLEALRTSKQQAEAFMDLLAKDNSPVDVEVLPQFFDDNVQEPLTRLSLLSHGFATPAMAVGVRMFVAFIDQQIQQLEEYCV